MAALSAQSRAHAILEAVRHTSNANIPALRQLLAQRPDALKLELTLRIILTYLPAATEPGTYVDLLHELSGASSTAHDEASAIFTPSEQALSEEDAHPRAKSLRLTPLIDPHARYDQGADVLTLFLLRQAHKIDSETGSLDLVAQLLDSFADHSEILRTWMISNLLPLLRLDYEYYPNSGHSYTLTSFEELEGSTAVQSLLSRAAHRNVSGVEDEDRQEVCRDIRGVVGPWIYGENTRKRRRLNQRSRRKSSVGAGEVTEDRRSLDEGSDWSIVNDWLLDLSLRDFQWSASIFEQWYGPSDVDYGKWGVGSQQMDEEASRAATQRYAQVGLAMVYTSNDHSMESIMDSDRILKEVARRAAPHDLPDLDRTDLKRTFEPLVTGITREPLDSLSPAHLHHNALLLPWNPFTTPTSSSIALLNIFNASCYKLLRLGNPKSSRTVADLCLFSSGADQMAELRRTLYKLKESTMEPGVWATTRRQVLWLRNWERQPEDEEDPRGVFCKIIKTALEHELLQAMLEGGCYQDAVSTYCKQAHPPLPMGSVEDTAISAALSFYDAASNCSRDRGGVQKAYQILEAFGIYFPDSKRFSQARALISATHGMSMYSLTLQRGVPFQPVNIRAHKDPISLIGKILEQNKRSYTELDNLLEIGQNLLAAGLLQGSQRTSPLHVSPSDTAQEHAVPQRRIMQMAIEAALKQDDFDTAYSYLVTRLSPVNHSGPGSWNEPARSGTQDDISWRVACEVGQYNATSTEKISTLQRIEQRMELLSQAILLAPTPALSEVLGAWQRCEQQLNAQIAREIDLDEHHDAKGDHKVPGEFQVNSSPVLQKARNPTRSALAEEAPIGLFDVARGAAAALSKSAFPLRGPQRGESAKSSHARPLSTASVESSDEGSVTGTGGQGRVRKRDMVSNMVTGGLASGIGWVIGESESLRRSLYAE